MSARCCRLVLHQVLPLIQKYFTREEMAALVGTILGERPSELMNLILAMMFRYGPTTISAGLNMAAGSGVLRGRLFVVQQPVPRESSGHATACQACGGWHVLRPLAGLRADSAQRHHSTRGTSSHGSCDEDMPRGCLPRITGRCSARGWGRMRWWAEQGLRRRATGAARVHHTWRCATMGRAQDANHCRYGELSDACAGLPWSGW